MINERDTYRTVNGFYRGFSLECLTMHPEKYRFLDDGHVEFPWVVSPFNEGRTPPMGGWNGRGEHAKYPELNVEPE